MFPLYPIDPLGLPRRLCDISGGLPIIFGSLVIPWHFILSPLLYPLLCLSSPSEWNCFLGLVSTFLHWTRYCDIFLFLTAFVPPLYGTASNPSKHEVLSVIYHLMWAPEDIGSLFQRNLDHQEMRKYSIFFLGFLDHN